MDIGRNLTLLRASKKLTQAEVATVLGVSRQTYIKLESNPKLFTQEQIEILKKLLDVEYEDIFLLSNTHNMSV